MGTISVEEYLNTGYHPDCEFVDGHVLERNWGGEGPQDDYLNFGVPYIWIVNPWNGKAYVVTQAGMVEAKSGLLATRDPDIAVPLNDLFSE